MAIALIATIVIGVVLAFKTLRQQWLIWLSLVLGFLVPVRFHWLGHHR